jgi:hypothetical protein
VFHVVLPLLSGPSKLPATGRLSGSDLARVFSLIVGAGPAHHHRIPSRAGHKLLFRCPNGVKQASRKKQVLGHSQSSRALPSHYTQYRNEKAIATESNYGFAGWCQFGVYTFLRRVQYPKPTRAMPNSASDAGSGTVPGAGASTVSGARSAAAV